MLSSLRPSSSSLAASASLALFLACAFLQSTAASAQQQFGHRAHYARNPHTLDRPWLVRNLRLSPNLLLPVTPLTLLLLFFSTFFIFRTIFKKQYAVASHILLDDASAESEDKLTKLKAEIGDDPAKFASAARKYSKCPSGKDNGGSLGKFGRGNMVPPFDAAVFGENRGEVKKVLGPIKTNFGWHLILIQEREM